jgi:hypothetical protein
MHVAGIKIENVRGFGEGAEGVNLDLADGGRRKLAGWTVFAGPNGSGKTTVLEAIAMTIAGIAVAPAAGAAEWIHAGAERATAEPHLHACADDDEPEVGYVSPMVWTPDGAQVPGPYLRGKVGYFVAAYGAHRRVVGGGEVFSTGASQYDGIGGLFREDAFLMESSAWLKDLDYRRLKGDSEAGALFDHLIALLEDDLLPHGVKILGVGPAGLRVKHKGVELSLQSLSHGYRTTTAFVMDLVMRMSRAFRDRFRVERHADGRPYLPHSGVVLVDEMELHLHPSWQQKIGFWLKAHFPNVQFLVTTHSPFICQAADTLVRLSIPGEGRPVAEIVDDATYNRVVGGGADDAVVSDLFGLEYPHSDKAEREREQLARLEVKELDKTLTPAEVPVLRELQRRLPATPSMSVERVLRKIANDR